MRHYDVVVAGGGMVGAAALRGLQLLNTSIAPTAVSPAEDAVGAAAASNGLRLLLADAAPPPTFAPGAVRHQVRTVAVTPMSARILGRLGAWDSVEAKHPYYRMAIRHETASAATASESHTAGGFFHALRGKSLAPLLEFSDLQSPMGFICMNDELQHRLFAEAAAAPLGTSTVIRNGASVTGVTPPPTGSPSLIEGVVQAQPGGEERFSASLVIGCDGGNSLLRTATGSASLTHDYAQRGFVCSVEIEYVDDGNMCCFQNFFESGDIVGFLPTGPKTANIVFSTTNANAARMTKLDSAALVAELNQRLHRLAPNDIPKITGVISDEKMRAVGAFPLRLIVATTPVANRLFLIGDAAHAVHPMAGQGLNLGLYDVAALVDQLRAAHCNGEDIGSAVVGQRLAAQMLSQTAPVIAAIEGIKTSVAMIPQLSCLGMSALNNIGPVKSLVTRFASGAHLAPSQPDDSLLFSRQ